MNSFIPTPPPNLSKLINHQRSQREAKASPTSLPGRFSRALRLGTMPSLSRTDSGYLFSGSKPASLHRSSASSDYFSLKSVSRPSSPVPSPPPSVAGSVTSSSGSAWRRPLICPARLKIGGHKLQFFTPEPKPPCASSPVSPSHFHVEPASSICSGRFSPDSFALQNHNELWSSVRDGSVVEEAEKGSNSSGSSACLVGTTTQGLEGAAPAKGFVKRLLWPLLLLVSLTANLFFSGLYMYHNWR